MISEWELIRLIYLAILNKIKECGAMNFLKYVLNSYIVFPLTILAVVLWYLLLAIVFVALCIVYGTALLCGGAKRIYEGVIKC